MNNTINKIERILKYFSIKSLIGSPKIFINKATIKNLQLLLINEAIINMIRFILNVPAEIVINLNGIGVKPAVNTIQKSQLLYNIKLMLMYYVQFFFKIVFYQKIIKLILKK